MRNRGIDVVSNMGASDSMMEEVQKGTVWSINGMECSFGPGEFLRVEMGDIDICVLKPCV